MTNLQQLLMDLSQKLGNDSAIAREAKVSPAIVSRWINDGMVPTQDHMLVLGQLAQRDRADMIRLWWEAHEARRARLPRRRPHRGSYVPIPSKLLKRPLAKVS